MISFEEFFTTVQGYSPFPWQSEAARRLVSGDPLDTVRVPTAAGKSALVDAAIYAAAHGRQRRIAFVVDRRIIVDAVLERAEAIANALLEKPELAELRNAVGDIQIVRLRGGVQDDDDWVFFPERLTVMASTVDQIGSRLLFRGYGVSPRMMPVHAGFVGNDTLIILDEAHLSQPFIDTVESVKGYGADVRLLVMTATPANEPSFPIDLSQEDRSHPVLKRRLAAAKNARFMEIENRRTLAREAADAATRFQAEGAKVVGVVVNRVNTAREIHEQLQKAKVPSVLLTGRVREYDRDVSLKETLPMIKAGRDRRRDAPLVVVTTQTIEVGADLDFDALVTESAPLSALRQRFGRLDRLGERGISSALVIHVAEKKDDPVYGASLGDTWTWLKAVAADGEVNFGINALAETMTRGESPVEPLPRAPVLLPTHINVLRQTGPIAPEVDVAPWLHGVVRASMDVNLIWRADLDEVDSSLWSETLLAAPPHSREAMQVPIQQFMAWLNQKRGAADIPDMEGSVAGEMEKPEAAVLRWRGRDDCELIKARDIRPGDTVVLPASRGGCDGYGWAPDSKAPVVDLGDWCALEKGRRLVRLTERLIQWAGSKHSPLHSLISAVIAAETNIDPETGVDEVAVKESHAALREYLKEIDCALVQSLKRYTIERYPAGLIIREKSMEDLAGSLTSGQRVPLDEHQEGVGNWAMRLADGHPLKARIKDAAEHHDDGKAEFRFQIMLHGEPIAASMGPLLAKSGIRRHRELVAAYEASGLPRGFRHELASVHLNREAEPLVRYLIGTHHGHGRPWYPRCDDPLATGQSVGTLGNGWQHMVETMNGGHNPWKLAGMETYLRASDVRRSMEERDRD